MLYIGVVRLRHARTGASGIPYTAMKINIAQSAGFCFGVKRAIQTAFQAAGTNKTIEMLGDIVHNEDVVRNIEIAGIKKIARLTRGKNKALLIRAHGAPASIYTRAHVHGYEIIDATCPMVKEIHTIARTAEKNGYRVIIIGDKKHDEVKGIIGQLQCKAIVIESRKTLPAAQLQRIKKACIVAQSTQNIETVNAVAAAIKNYIPSVLFKNTICNPTKIKQAEMKKMPLENDVMIIVGSKGSANTQRLYEISRSLNPRSYWIGSADELRTAWFRKAHSVGITAGASTPDETTSRIVAAIRNLQEKTQPVTDQTNLYGTAGYKPRSPRPR